MPKLKTTKVKKHFSLDISVFDEIRKKSNKMNLKKSYIVNQILREFFFDECFATADKMDVGNNNHGE